MKENKNIFIGCIIFIIIVSIMFIISLFFKDNRENIANIPSEKLIFDKTVINVEQYLWNKKNEKARIKLSELYFKNTDKDFSIKIKDQDQKDQEVSITENKTKEIEEGDMILQTDYTIEFSMPKETSYIQCEISKNDIYYTILMDSKYFKKAKF